MEKDNFVEGIIDPLKRLPAGFSETSEKSYHYSLRYNPEDRSSQLCRRFENCLSI